ncbi:hypothetical protein NZD89_06510 [Alicyclobacillus fastidiosus]|uniref:Uncharacterized protein n=1 Tax=Alicyclobacillus fastidiosus TaxID=392011 RepID=A0ABY6ZLI2_9BACL|nr:hypothetical protein [Alicyclobacillus fastidiosus]WAH43056.1 hypothetical protein NZD89_06510 [Alicyclobacillus fastidiosus]GMA65042.1 hypothetical protein GCM10025859_54820 [Alicyclobacillus fastidiosus]
MCVAELDRTNGELFTVLNDLRTIRISVEFSIQFPEKQELDTWGNGFGFTTSNRKISRMQHFYDQFAA